MANSNKDRSTEKRQKLTGWPRPKTGLGESLGLNPLRIALLIALAVAGLGGGYLIGRYVAPAPKPAPSAPAAQLPKAAPQPQSPQAAPSRETPKSFDEPLPRDVVIEKDGVLARIDLPNSNAEIDLGIDKVPDPGPPAAETAATPPPPASAVAPEPTAPPTSPAPTYAPAAEVAPETAAPATQRTEVAEQPQDGPQTLVAALPADIVKRQAEAADTLPAWQRYALPVAPTDLPKIVIVIDDLGLDRRRTRETIALPGPLTLSFLSYAEELTAQARAARKNGHELLLHIPMEPTSNTIDPGPNVLLSAMPADEVSKNIAWDLDQLDGIVGINNHMGSRFTADAEGMKVVVEVLKNRGLMFLDSMTAGDSVAHHEARKAGIPFAVRNVFLDHDDDLAAIRRQLRTTEQVARKTGVAIAIGHPRDNTLAALREWLPTLQARGFQLVPVTGVARIAPGN